MCTCVNTHIHTCEAQDTVIQWCVLKGKKSTLDQGYHTAATHTHMYMCTVRGIKKRLI